jgi:hypothetical protein
MTFTNTFGVHFVLRANKKQNDKFPVYARITVNKTRCELALKQYLNPNDWNQGKGMCKPKNEELKQFNSYLEQVRAKFASHFRDLQLNDETITAADLKNAFIGVEKEEIKKTLVWLAKQHNLMMQ